MSLNGRHKINVTSIYNEICVKACLSMSDTVNQGRRYTGTLKIGVDRSKFLISYPSIVVAAVLTALFICSILSLSSAFPFLPDLHRSAEMAAIRVRKMKTRILIPSLKMWFMSWTLARFRAPFLGDSVKIL